MRFVRSAEVYETRHNLRPHLSLFGPGTRFGDGADFAFQDCVPALDGSRQFEILFLNVGGQLVEPPDLGHACHGEPIRKPLARRDCRGSALQKPGLTPID
jgi:hypothetical protein